MSVHISRPHQAPRREGEAAVATVSRLPREPCPSFHSSSWHLQQSLFETRIPSFRSYQPWSYRQNSSAIPLSSIIAPPSNGIGSGGGIGSGSGGGVGSGSGPGVGAGSGGSIGGGVYRVGGGVTAPRLIYAPDPGFSEEARQAKYQGAVVVWLIVGTGARKTSMLHGIWVWAWMKKRSKPFDSGSSNPAARMESCGAGQRRG